MSSNLPRVEVISEPLPDSPYFKAASDIIAARFWPLSEASLQTMRDEAQTATGATVLSFDETGLVNGVAIVRLQPNQSTAFLNYLAAGRSENQEANGRGGKPVDTVVFTETDSALLASAEDMARRRGIALMRTVGIAVEQRWLEQHGYSRERPDASFMQKQLNP